MKTSIRIVAICLALSLLGAGLRADDLKLKDGSKITGTIVGFDDNSFKVQTSYGFALVRKDQVVSITVSTPPAPKAPAQPATTPAPTPGPATANEKTAQVSPEIPKAPAAAPKSTTSNATALSKAPAAPPPPSTPPTPAAAPVPPAPEPIRENVDGNTYTNLTYGFHMYKPPGWNVIEGARSLMPGAITAMGTLDKTTYLLIGQAPAGKSLASDIDSADRRLRGLMDNFRPLGESRITVSGAQAVERKFRGGLDEKDWSGTVVYFSRSGQLYTIFGMTIADTDLVQIQENVIGRAIASLQFAQ